MTDNNIERELAPTNTVGDRVGTRRIILPDVSRYARYGRMDHAAFISEIERQSQNRRDFLIIPGEATFEGYNLKVRDLDPIPMDPISMTTLAERFKQGGSYTVTRRGLVELMKAPDLFEQVGNYFMRHINNPFQLRTLFGLGIAVPSKYYVNVNHKDLMDAILDVLGNIFGQDPQTSHNYMDKSIAYAFVPIPELDNILLRNYKGYEDRYCVGIEIRNSEILEHAVTVSFKIVRLICNNGIVLGDTLGNVYQRHIKYTTEEILNNVRRELILMFQDNMEKLFNILETLRWTMETQITIENGPAINEEFCRMFNLTDSQNKKMVQQATYEDDNTLYGWTLGPLSYLANERNNRFLQESDERAGSSLLTDEHLRERLMNLIS